MKKIVFSFTILIFATGAAETQMQPFSGNGLQIISLAQQQLPASLKLQTQNQSLEMKEKGFYEMPEENRYAQYLLNIKMHAYDQLRAYHNTQDAYDTHLKKSLQEIKLAFTFKKLPIDDEDIIGYTPIGSYVKSPAGWNGIKVFFANINVGICAYEFTDLNLSHGGVQLVKEYINYSVNNKPTTFVVEGNQTSGFTYSVIWYDGIKINTVDCAQKHYSKNTLQKVILLANRIDKAS